MSIDSNIRIAQFVNVEYVVWPVTSWFRKHGD